MMLGCVQAQRASPTAGLPKRRDGLRANLERAIVGFGLGQYEVLFGAAAATVALLARPEARLDELHFDDVGHVTSFRVGLG